jgi:uncharacterized membrane protein YbhN (UPF0104 family)
VTAPEGVAAPRGGLRRSAKSVVLVLGLIALAVAARRALRDAEGVTLPGPGALVAGFVLTRLALSCSARAWVALLGSPADPHLVTGALYQSQLVKYLPAGGLVQAAGQVAMTATHGIPVRRVSLAYLTHAASTVAAGSALGAALALSGDLEPWARAASLLGLGGLVLADRRLLAWLLALARRVTARIPEPDLLPDQRSMVVALAWCAANHVLYASGFTVLLHAVDPDIPVVTATLGYVLSWVVGFLVLPLPSGIGVREAVLVAVVPGAAAGPLLAASLAQRLVAIAAEVAAAGTNRAIRHFSR